MVRQNELACRDTWDHSLWQPMSAGGNGAAAVNGADPFEPIPARRERPATPEELAAVVKASSSMPELDIPDSVHEDVMVGEAAMMPAAIATVRRAEREPVERTTGLASEHDNRATLLAQDPRAAIRKARERHRERIAPRTREMEFALAEQDQSAEPAMPTATGADGDAPKRRGAGAEAATAAHSRNGAEEQVGSVTSGHASNGAPRATDVGPPSQPPRRSVAASDPYDEIPERREEIALPRLERESVSRSLPVAGLNEEPEPVRRGATRTPLPPLDRRGKPAPGRLAAARTPRTAERPTQPEFTASVQDNGHGQTPPTPGSLTDTHYVPQAPIRGDGSIARPAASRVVDRPSAPRGRWDAPVPSAQEQTVVPRWANGSSDGRTLGREQPRPPRHRAEAAPPAERLRLGATSDVVDYDNIGVTEGGCLEPSFDGGYAAIAAPGTANRASPSVVAVAGRHEIDDTLVETAVQIAPLIPRTCRTCRDFRPTDDEGHGVCGNRWAFTHPQPVTASDPEPPCQCSLGCWWLPTDRVWAEAADVSSHGLPTPLLERWVPQLSAKRTSESSEPALRRRPS